MANAKYRVPFPSNEPIKSYTPESPERGELRATLARLKGKQIEIPLIIGGQEVKTGKVGQCVIPHDHQQVIATYHQAGKKEVQMAIEAALKARKHWTAMDWHDRVSVFLKASHLLAGPWRSVVNGSSVLGQSKTAYQAEIDAACEFIDFMRFNCYYAMEIRGSSLPPHPLTSPPSPEISLLHQLLWAMSPCGNRPQMPFTRPITR